MKNNYSLASKLLTSNLKQAWWILRAFSEQLFSKWFAYPSKSGKSRYLPLVTLKITPLCNLRCVMCGQRGEKGTLKGTDAIEKAKDIVSFEGYKKFTDEVSKKAKVFYVWGGEPFMYPNFMDLAQYMIKKIPLFTVNTNGTYLAENAERIVRDRWSGIFISLDGFEDVNDAIRGKGSYRKVIEGIEAINREKERQKSKLPHLGIVTTVSNMNYEYLDKLVEATSKVGLSWHIINLGTYFTEEIGQKHSAYFKEKFGVDATYWKGFTTGHNEGIDGEKFSRILERVHSFKVDYPIITVPVIRPEMIGVYYSQLERVVRDRCSVAWNSVNIDYNGDVHICADYPDWVFGNIKNESIFKIYNSERAIKFRKELHDSPDGLFPGCRRCYQLMLCGDRRPEF